MCANYEAAKREAINQRRRLPPDFGYPEMYPGKVGPLITNEDTDSIRPACFGLVPHWGDIKLARRTYNARSETVAKLPSFRAAWKARRLAVIPMQAFYEPCWESGQAVRWRIERADGEIFGVAGIWEHRFDDQGPARWSFSMLTISATDHPMMRRFHGVDNEKRSVVILDDDEWDDWLSAKDEGEIRSFLRPFDPGPMVASPSPRAAKQK